MADHRPSLFPPGCNRLILPLTALFFLFFTWALRPFVPDERATVVWVVSAFTASCLTGVFFIAAHMFRVVLADQRSRRGEP